MTASKSSSQHGCQSHIDPQSNMTKQACDCNDACENSSSAGLQVHVEQTVYQAKSNCDTARGLVRTRV